MKNKITKIITIIPIAFFFALFFVLFFFSFFQNASADTNDTMLGYWKFDGDASDYSNDGNTGVLNGGAAYIANVPSGMNFPDTQSVGFGGTGSYVSVANGTGVQPTSGVTFSLWVYLDALPGSSTTIGGNYNSGNPNTGFQFIVGPGQTSFRIGNTMASYSTALPVATWSHLAGTWDGATIKLFLNGTLQSSVSFAGPLNYSSTTFELGNFQGKLDDVRLYKRALLDSEINDLASKKHTKATWQGLSSSDYSAYPNWDTLAAPDPFTLVTISSSGTAPVFTQSEAMAGLTIQSGASLDIGQQNLTMHDNAFFVNNGNFTLANFNTQILNGFVNDTTHGTITLKMPAAVTGLKAGSTYNNLVISSADTNPYVLTLNSNLVVNGNLTVNNYGILNASNFQVSIKGNFSTGTSGQFSPGSSTVHLTGVNQVISGTNNFWNLSKVATAADTLYFPPGGTQTIQNSLTLQGFTGNLLNLRSTTNGTQWSINPQGTKTLSYLNVKDSNNTSGTAIMVAGNNFIDAGNNTNWIFDNSAPVISLDAINLPTNDNTPNFTGSATDLYSAVSSVEYQVDSYSGTWHPCTAQDGTYNQLTELFICTPATALTDGTHTIYFRATDSNSNMTTSGNYSSASVTIDTTAPVRSNGSPSGTLNAGTTSTVLTLMTDETATCRFSTTPGIDYSTMANDTTVASGTGHSATISGLQNGTSYIYYVRCRDGNQNANTDDYLISFSVAADSGGSGGGGSSNHDISVHIKNPTSDQVVTDKEFTFKADTNNADSVKFYYKKSGSDEKNYLGEDTTDDSGLFSLKVSIEDKFSNGDYVLVAKAINGNDEKSDEMKFSVKLTYSEIVPGSGSTTETTNNTNAASNSDSTDQAAATPQTSTTNPIGSSNAPLATDSNNNTLALDSDNDGVPDSQELQLGTNPNSSDSDGDGIPDETEILNGTDPNQAGKNGSDKITFESPKDKGAVNKDYKVNNVETIQKNGEKVLKFSGQSLPNTFVTLYIYSNDPIIVRVKTDENGNWNYEMTDNLDNGNHEVYVALTDSQGKMKDKSEPLRFVKTAQAISVIPFAEAAPSDQSPVDRLRGNLVYSLIAISAIFIIIAIIVISFVAKKNKKEENIQPTVMS
jgi:hypothetical protein